MYMSAAFERRPLLSAPQAGQAVPLKFSLDGNHGLDIFANGYPKSVAISCDFAAPIDVLEETLTGGQQQSRLRPVQRPVHGTSGRPISAGATHAGSLCWG